MSDITIRQDATYVYADAFEFTPGSELYIELRSKPVPPNDSTEGATTALHKTVAANGECHFKVVRAALLLDENLPREVTAFGPISSEVITA